MGELVVRNVTVTLSDHKVMGLVVGSYETQNYLNFTGLNHEIFYLQKWCSKLFLSIAKRTKAFKLSNEPQSDVSV